MLSLEEWQQRINETFPQIILLNKTRPKGTKDDPYLLYCNICGGNFEANRKALQTAYYIRKKEKIKCNWCPICNGGKCVKGINDIATIRKDLVKYFVNLMDAEKFSTGSHKRVKLKCPDCGKIKESTVADLCAKGFSCNYCSDKVSFPNKICRNLIIQLPVDEYDFEFVDTWTQNKRYDCYFRYKNKKYLIEIDGEQHIKNTSWSSKQWQEENDKLKTKLALENGYNLIRIKAYHSTFEYIKQSIFESELSNIFNLDLVEWEKIYEKAITNMNLELGKFYMEHTEMTLKDIAKYFHISMPTLNVALTKLTNLGLCNYKKHCRKRRKDVITSVDTGRR